MRSRGIASAVSSAHRWMTSTWLASSLGELVDLVQVDEVDGLLHEVHDVVETCSEPIDVLAVERGDERRVDSPDDRVGRLVAVVLGLAHPLGRGRAVSVSSCSISASRSAPVIRLLRRLGEEVEERLIRRLEAEAHGNSR